MPLPMIRPTSVPSIQLITDIDALILAVRELRSAPRLGLDTEGNGMHSYRTSLCLIQLCVAHETEPAETVYLVDPLTLPTLEPLREILGPNGPEVVIHDLAFDVRMLVQCGLDVGRVVDTALHARFLGLKETGLGALLNQRFAVQLDKAHQQDDWARRPLDEEQLGYLVADVAHLGPLAKTLEADAATAGIAAEVAVETEYALANAREPEDSSAPPYVRIKGAMDLFPSARAALRAMALVREEAAVRENLPVGRIVSNASLLALAKQRPTTVMEVRKLGGLYDRGAAIAGNLLAALQAAARVEDIPEEERAAYTRSKLPPGEFHVRRARETALSAWRRKVATERTVDMQVVLPGHALSDIVRAGPRSLADLAAIDGLGAVRIARDGEAILKVLEEAAAKKTEG